MARASKSKKARGIQNFPPGQLSSRNALLVSMLKWRIYTVATLPKACLESLRVHMKKTPAHVREVLKELGPKTQIGVVTIPMQLMQLQVMNDNPRKKGFKTFEEYHHFYCSKEKVPKHKHRWPIVLSGPDWASETIIDGWHRFHSYFRQGRKSVRAIWYVD